MSVISSLLGLDASHNAGVAQTNATNQQTLQNQYGAQGAQVYGNLAGSGAQQAGSYNSQYLGLLNNYAGLAGLGSPIATNQTSTNPNQKNAPTVAGTPGQAQGQQAANPYQLDNNQQQLLNQSMAQVQQSAQQAVQSFQQGMAANGINDPRALESGTQRIQEHFAAIGETAQAQFYEQAKQDKLTATQGLLTGLSQYGQQGIQQEEAAGSGYLGLASGAQAAANAQQSTSLQQQQLSNQQLGGFLQLAAFAGGGGFSG